MIPLAAAIRHSCSASQLRHPPPLSSRPAMAAAAAVRSLLRTTTIAAAAAASPPSSLHIRPHTHPSSQLRLLVPHTPRRRRLFSSVSGAGGYTSDESNSEEEQQEAWPWEEEKEEELAAEFPPPRASSPARPPRGQEPGRLFVGNLPFSMTSQELGDAFSEAGTVSNVQLIYNRVTDRSRGFAFVTMATPEEATKAIQMFNGAQLGGRTVQVNFPDVPRGGEREVARAASARGGGWVPYVDSPCKVYAGNLGWGVRADKLRAAFAAQHGLLGASVAYDRDTGRSRGFGFLSFQTAEDVQAAIEAMNGVELEGRPLRLKPAKVGPTDSSSGSPEMQEQQEGSTSESVEAEMEESNLQASPSY